ncbi:MAG TPA: hypothetical protein PKZ49_11890 [Nitrosomonas sp.]|nr:hypothetical protein [Nitrosomonas sp.]HNH52667.1 hypothetical protein [Nitrosomonas sp.]
MPIPRASLTSLKITCVPSYWHCLVKVDDMGGHMACMLEFFFDAQIKGESQPYK